MKKPISCFSWIHSCDKVYNKNSYLIIIIQYNIKEDNKKKNELK